MSLQVVGANSTFFFFRLQVLRKEQLNVMKSPGPFSSFAKAALPSLSLTYLSLRCSCVRSPGNSPGDRCHPVSDWLPRPFLPHCLPAQLHRPGGVMWQQCHLSWYWLCDRWAGTDRLTLPGLVLHRDSDGADAWLRSRCLGRGLRRALVPANGKGGRGNFIYFSVGWFPAGWHRDKQDHHRQYYS